MAKKKATTKARDTYVAPRVASEVLGVTTATLRIWAKKGKIASIKLPSGHARYDISGLVRVMGVELPVQAAVPAPVAPATLKAQTPAVAAPVATEKAKPKPKPVVERLPDIAVPAMSQVDLIAEINRLSAR